MNRPETLHAPPVSIQSDVVNSDPTRRIFWAFMAVHLAIWTLVPALTQPNAPLDAVEMLYWGHEWEWGYYKHPPLASWVAEIASVLDNSEAWPTYLVSQICIVGCFWAAWSMARKVLPPWPALTAPLLMEACHYYNFTTPELNNNILAKIAWALSVLFLYNAITRQRAIHWVATGVCLGLAMLSKYDAAILIVALVAFSLVHPRARRCWRTSGPYLMSFVALALFSPHLFWLVKNDFPTIRYFFERSENSGGWLGHVTNPIGFAGAQLMAVGLVLLICCKLFGKRWTARSNSDDEPSSFQRQYLAVVLFGPFALVLLLSLVTGAHVRSMWGSPMWTHLGLFLLLQFETRGTDDAYRSVVRYCMIITVGLAVVFGARNVLSPHLRSKPSRIHYPGRALAEAVDQRWHERYEQPLPLVGGLWWMAGNVGLYYPGRVSVYADMSTDKSPWATDERLARDGGVILWEIDKWDTDQSDSGYANAGSSQPDLNHPWHDRFPEAEVLEPITIPWRTSADLAPLVIGIAIIDPGSPLPLAEQNLSIKAARGATP